MINRRSFLQGVAGAGLALAGQTVPALAAPSAHPLASHDGKWRGVNLGAWLVLEKWLVPSVFQGLKATDEYTFCRELGPKEAGRRLRRHWDTWITDKDFAWLAARGLNAVRLPLGYWVLGGEPPYVAADDVVDRAFAQAKAHGIGVLLDLHGAPGSQNGNDHSGRAGALEWPRPENVARTLDIVERLAARYGHWDNLIGFELLNEPSWSVPMSVLKPYYEEGYRRVRTHVSPEVAIVMHDGFRPLEWAGFMPAPEYRNALLDAHLYQVFTDEDRKRTIYEQVSRTATTVKQQLDKQQAQLPAIVGEWSSALAGQALSGLSGFAADQGKRAYGDAQLLAYETTRGWFFWTYKAEYSTEWNFRDCVARGLLPSNY